MAQSFRDGQEGSGRRCGQAFERSEVPVPYLIETNSYRLCHDYGMAVRTTIDLPEPLHDRLRDRAERSGASIRSLIVDAIE
jgi:hypothetical protein